MILISQDYERETNLRMASVVFKATKEFFLDESQIEKYSQIEEGFYLSDFNFFLSSNINFNSTGQVAFHSQTTAFT